MTNIKILRKALLAFLVVVSTTGVIGNTVVSWIYAFRLDKAKSRDRYFLLVLAVVDNAGCIFQGTHQILRTIDYDFPGQFFCCFLMFFVMFAVGASAMILLFIAIHRYRKVCQPFRRKLTNIFLRRVCLVISFVAGVVYAIPIGIMEYSNSAFLYKIKLQNGSSIYVTKYKCGLVNHASLFDFVWIGLGLVLIILLSLITVGLYFPVIYHTRKMARKYGPGNENDKQVIGQAGEKGLEKARTSPLSRKNDNHENEQDGDNGRQETATTASSQPVRKRMGVALSRLNTLCLVMAIVNMVSYVPYCTIISLYVLKVDLQHTLAGIIAMQFFLCIPLLQHVVNPFINIAFDLELRKGIIKLFTSISW